MWETSFPTVYGRPEGYRIYADRSVAEKIEIQTRYVAELYNVDIRRDQQCLAERDIFPCGEKDASCFFPDFASPSGLCSITSPEIRCAGGRYPRLRSGLGAGIRETEGGRGR